MRPHVMLSAIAGLLLSSACGGDSPTRPRNQPGASAAIIRLQPDSVLLEVGDSARFQAQVLDQRGEPYTPEGGVTWSVSDTAIARVDTEGWVTARRAGEFVLTATAETISRRATGRVWAARPERVQVEPTAVSVMVGDTVRLRATVYDQLGRVHMPEGGIRWVVSDTMVARVDAGGLVTARAVGDFRVVAAAGEVSDSVGGSARERPTLVLSATSVTLPILGDSTRIRATFGADTTSSPTLASVSEERWFRDQAVLDGEALRRSVIRALHPGTVRLSVSAFGADPQEVVVRVAPPAPYVRTLTAPDRSGTGESLHLLGYRLHDVATSALTWDGAPAEVVARDSANLHLRIPTPATCAGGAWSAFSAKVGAGTHTHRVRHERAGEVALAAGAMLRLTGEQAACLQLAPDGEAEYALAYVDPRSIRRAERDGRELALRDSSFRVTGSDRTTGIASTAQRVISASRSSSAPAHRSPSRSSASSSETLYDRRTPWKVGDRFTVRPSGYTSADTATVVQLYGGYYVLAVMDRDAAHLTSAWRTEFDRSMKVALSHGVPYLRRTVYDSLPVTSPGTGQFVLIAGKIAGEARSSETRVELRIDETGATETAAPPRVLHQLAHTYQYLLRRWESCGGSSECAYSFPIWGLEGGADFMAHEIIREARGYAFDGNTNFFGASPDADVWSFAYEATEAKGDFVAGYAGSAAFHRDQVHRLVRSGLGYDRAARLVAAGSLEGWYGYDFAGLPVTGLAARVRARLGAGWTPEGAMLLWVASLAADDQTSSAELQEPSVAYATGGPGHIAASAGSERARISGGTGASATYEHPFAGGYGYFTLLDAARGGSYRFQSTATGTVWMLVRVR